MKKILYFIIIIVLLFFAFGYFVNSNYFFNRYVAKNIKDYGFNYTKAKGEIFKGFLVEGLRYKNKELSSNVELKIDSLKLLTGVISVKQLHLIGVRKDVLEDVVKDFTPTNDNNNSTKIDIDFEFKNILITLKPFSIDKIKVKKAILSVDKISYINRRFSVGNLEYQSKSNLADIEFKGEFHKKILKIDKIEVKNLDSTRFLSILKEYKTQESNGSLSNSEIFNSPFTPKSVLIKSAKLKLLPFKYNNLSIENLNIDINNAKFDVKHLLIKNANIYINYKSQAANIALLASYKNSNLNIYRFIADLKEPNKIENFITNNLLENSDVNNTDNKIIVIDKIALDTLKIKVKNYYFKNEKIKKIVLSANGIKYNNLTKKILFNNLNLYLNSSILTINLDSKLDNNLKFKYLKIKSKDTDKLISLASNNKESNGSIKINIPDNYIIEKLKVDIKKATFGTFVLNEGILEGKKIVGKTKELYIQQGFIKANALSPWGKANLSGSIKNNNYYAKGSYKVSNELFNNYSIPLKAKNIKKLNIQGRFGFDSLELNTSLQGKDIIDGFDDIEIISSKNSLNYKYGDKIIWDIDADIKTPFISKAKVINRLVYDNKLLYYGKIIPNKENLFNSDILNRLLQNYLITYKGDSDNLNAILKSKYLSLNFSTNYKTANIDLNNIKKIYLSEFINIPTKLKESTIEHLEITSNLNFNKIYPIKGFFKLKSNLVNLDGDWLYSNNFNSNFKTTIPKNSLLIKEFKNLNYNTINSFKSELSLNKKLLNLEFKNRYISLDLNYILINKLLNTKIGIGASIINFSGNLDNIKSNIKITSIKNFIKNLKKVYKIDIDNNIDGDINLLLNINNFKNLSYKIYSKKILLNSSSKISNLKINGIFYDNVLNIDRYSFEFNKYNFFSTLSSKLLINNQKLLINKLWVNDTLLINGVYNLKDRIGNFNLKSDRFKLNSQQANIDLLINLKAKINKNKKEIKGLIDILNGKLKSSITRKNIADNEDIIILQRKRKKENTEFAKNTKLNIKIKSKKGLVYSQYGSYFKLIPNISIKKEYDRLSNFKGKIKISKNSYYMLKGKKLKIVKGDIIFKGKSTSPNLNIELKYKGENYKVYIDISGTPTNPILYFRSNPPLSKEEILAYLLFDDISAVGTHSQESMLNMIGGSLAKSLLSSIGIKIDHISVKENGFSIGKKIGKKIMIYYNQDGEKASIKTKIDITKSINTEIEIGKDKQSVDIIFSNEY